MNSLARCDFAARSFDWAELLDCAGIKTRQKRSVSAAVILKVWRVEKIRGISSELQIEALCKLERPEQAEVEVYRTRPQKCVTAYCSISICSWVRKRGRIIERQARADSTEFLYGSNLVGSFGLAHGIQCCAGRESEGLAGDGAEDTAGLPASQHLGRHATATCPLLARPNWQFVNVSQLEDLRGIEACLGSVPPKDIRIVPIKSSPPVVVGPVDRFGVGVGPLDHQTARELPVDGNLQGVVIGAQVALPKQGTRRAVSELGFIVRLSCRSGPWERGIHV